MASSNNEKTAVWFITGCSTGIGRALADRVLARGYRCVVTARSLAQVEPIAAAHPQRALALALDVTDPAQREAAVAKAEAHFGGIDVLVNNAGSGYNVAVEEANEDAVRAMFEVNFFGLVAMMRRVLPGMRARGSGHIINVSSVAGLIGNPGSAYYCATKFAVEGLSQGLAKETESLGIRVTLIEPGPFRTDFQGRSMRLPERILDAYAQTAGARRAQLRAGHGQQPGDPVRAADAIVDVYESPQPPLQLLMGKSGFDRVREARAEQARSMDEWERVTLATDFPARG